MGVLISREKSSDNTFYRFGPHSDFIVLGIHIDTFDKYLLVLLYCACNTAMRNIRNDIILPWVTLTVFDTSPEAMDRKLTLSHKMAYEICNQIDYPYPTTDEERNEIIQMGDSTEWTDMMRIGWCPQY